MRLTALLLSLFALTSLALPARSSAADISALLVTASKSPGPSDARLKPYEANLRRILRFESFRLIGEGGAHLSPPGKGQIGLGGGHSLRLEIANEKSGRVDVTWQQGNRILMQTGLSLRPGVPAILGGPGTGRDGEVYAIIVTSR